VRPRGPGRAALLAVCALALGLGCLLAAGCASRAGVQQRAPGSAANKDANVALIAAAARATLAGTAGVEFELRGASALGGSRAPALGSGQLDFRSASGAIKLDLGESGGAEPGNEQALFLGERVYLQPKGTHGGAVLPAGREWVVATLGGSDAVETNFPSFALQAEAIDPQLLLAELAGGALAAAPTPGALVEGAPARGYLVTVDLARALTSLHGPGAAALARAVQSELASPGARGGRTTIAVWLDARERVVRLRSAPPGAGVGTATMTLCCFGLPAPASAPPAARVVDLAALTPSGERENNGGGDSDGG
jgi:hypothetical protein